MHASLMATEVQDTVQDGKIAKSTRKLFFFIPPFFVDRRRPTRRECGLIDRLVGCGIPPVLFVCYPCLFLLKSKYLVSTCHTSVVGILRF